MFVDKMGRMNLSSMLLNAYKNSSKSKSDSGSASKNSDDDVFVKIGKDSAYSKNAQPSTPSKSYLVGEGTSATAKALTAGGLLKVPTLPREKDGRENVYRRVAKFLLLIGVDEAAKILPHLTEAQTEKIIPEIASIQRVDPDEAEEILAEFKSLLGKARESGGVNTAKEMLTKAFGAEVADKYLSTAAEALPVEKPFEYLQEADSEKISILLKDESNAVRTLILSYLKPKVAADVIKGMSEEDKKDVVLRLASLQKINPAVVKAVDKAMHEKVNKLSIQKSDSIDGRSALAQILRRMDPNSEMEILGTLSEHDEELGADLKKRLFTLEDIIAADDLYIQNYLRSMDDNDIAMLISNKKEDFREKILGNVSQNRRKTILDAEEINKPMRRSEVDNITSDFINQMRQAFDEGKLFVNGRDGEFYV